MVAVSKDRFSSTVDHGLGSTLRGGIFKLNVSDLVSFQDTRGHFTLQHIHILL